MVKKSQVEKFNARYGKVRADEVAVSKQTEQKIATQVEENRKELNAISVLTHTVQILSKQVEGLLKEKVINSITMDGIGDMLHTLIDRQANAMTEIDVRINILLESHRNYLLVTQEELHELGISHYVNHLHQYRADQIKYTGTYTDSLVALTTTPEIHVADKEWLLKPLTKTKSEIKMPRGPKPPRIKEALEIMDKHKSPKGSFRWITGGKDLVFAVLTYLEWLKVDIKSSLKLQQNKTGASLHNRVITNKDVYGIAKWSDLISQYNAVKEVK